MEKSNPRRKKTGRINRTDIREIRDIVIKHAGLMNQKIKISNTKGNKIKCYITLVREATEKSAAIQEDLKCKGYTTKAIVGIHNASPYHYAYVHHSGGNSLPQRVTIVAEVSAPNPPINPPVFNDPDGE